jgi:2-amino-4-hydroxy-6-hydroxymethyldihydropteridine diphosphokinase
VHTAYLRLGSNLGDRRGHLVAAVRRLNGTPGIRVVTVSSIFETKPVGHTAQPDFLNLVAAVATALAPHALLDTCLRIETELGRVRHERWGPRTVDLDLLSYEDIRIDDARFTLPHPRMLERGFVLVPLAEIAPGLIIAGEAITTRAVRCDQSGLRKLGPFEWAGDPPAFPQPPV